MPSYGQITGSDAGHDGTWLVEMEPDSTPIPDFTLIPLETMPDVVPLWTIRLRTAITPVVWTILAVLACVVAPRLRPWRSALRA